MGRPKRYTVDLTTEERNYLLELLTGGTQKVRKLKRAQILLKADDGWTASKLPMPCWWGGPQANGYENAMQSKAWKPHSMTRNGTGSTSGKWMEK